MIVDDYRVARVVAADLAHRPQGAEVQRVSQGVSLLVKGLEEGRIDHLHEVFAPDVAYGVRRIRRRCEPSDVHERLRDQSDRLFRFACLIRLHYRIRHRLPLWRCGLVR